MTRSRRWLFATGAALVLLAIGAGVFRATLPRLLLDRFHRDTARLGDDYRGLAGGVDVELWNRRYRLRDVRIVRRDGRIDAPLLAIARIDVGLEPMARRSRVLVDGVRAHLVGGPGEPVQLGQGVAWRRLLGQLAPGMTVQRVEFTDVGVRFHRAREPRLVLTLDNLHGAIEGLAEAEAHLDARGLLMAHAPLQVDLRFDPQGAPDAFRLRARARQVELAKLDAFARRWARLDFSAGEGELALALDAAPPRVHGVATVALSGVDVFDLDQDVGQSGLAGAMRELIAGAGLALEREPGSGRIDREFAIDARVASLPDDNFDGLRALLQAALADLGRYLPE